MITLNATHDPARRSWVASANAAQSEFPIQNLPHGVFSTGQEAPRGGVAIGDQILDLQAAVDAGLFSSELSDIARAAAEPSLNRLMAMGNAAAAKLRARLSDLLSEDGPERAKVEALAGRLLVPMASAQMHVPAAIGGFTDFCTSVPHLEQDRPARPGTALHPAFKHIPIAYSSRASSVVVDGVPLERPHGVSQNYKTGEVLFAPTRLMDFELEFGVLVGPGNALGHPINMDDAPGHIWGYVLVNDWSSRDVQFFESMLGPFLSKGLRTTISPWIVTAAAMAPFHTGAPARAEADPKPLPYLTSARHEAEGGLNVGLQAFIRTARMRAAGEAPHLITDTRIGNAFWTFEQMLVHHASNGCNLQTGDLLGSGTVSGPDQSEAACFWELTGGRIPLELPNGETRKWIEDGDEIILRAKAAAPGARAIGFGDCGAELTPAKPWPAA